MLHFSRMKSLINPSTLSKPTPFAPLLSSLPTMSVCFSAKPTTLLNPVSLPLKPLTLSPKPSFFRCLQFRASSSSSPSPSPGQIHVIVGPMFSGKTTTLLRRVQTETSDGSFQVKHLLQLDRTLKDLCFTGRVSEAVRLLWRKGVAVNHGTYALLLQECIFWKQFNRGRRIHAQMVVVGYVPNGYLKTKLLILYAKSGDLKTAQVLFRKIEKKIISWNAMISGYVQNGFEKMGLCLYFRMRETGLTPDQYTFASVFRACATLASLEHGKQAHAVMIKCSLRENVVITSALVDMYFKCSHLFDGHKVFDKSLNRNVVTWTSLISGYGHHGSVTEVLQSFHRMKDEGCQPNYVTFLVVLSACSHGGFIDDGWNYFLSMKNDYGIQPRGQHYAAMVDLLGRAGRLKEAYEFVLNSPYDEHSVIWGALLNACRIHGDMDLLKITTKKYFELDPKNAGKYVVLSNAYATFGFWDNVEEVRKTMRDAGMIKEPAYSSIEIQREVRFFLMGDKSHQNSEEIYKMLFKLTYILNDTGFVPDISDH